MFEGCSPLSGAFVVEDVSVDGATHRRLVFLDNQMLVQSEAKLKESELIVAPLVAAEQMFE